MTTNHLPLLLGAIAFFANVELTASAETVPVAQSDARIRTVLYAPGQVTRLHAWVGYHIDVVFEPGESLVTVGGGDLDALTYGSVENHFFLKPRAAPVRTNLTVVTNRRTYVLDYIVSAGVPDVHSDDVIYSLRFTYPAAVNGPTNAQLVAEDFAAVPEHGIRNFDYWYCGEPGLQPIAASDDGVHTRLRFGERAEIPAIFVRSDDGSESLLNFSVDSGDVVIHRTARRLILRRGRLAGCVVNKGYSGAGERLDTGTISPHVRRETPQVRP